VQRIDVGGLESLMNFTPSIFSNQFKTVRAGGVSFHRIDHGFEWQAEDMAHGQSRHEVLRIVRTLNLAMIDHARSRSAPMRRTSWRLWPWAMSSACHSNHGRCDETYTAGPHRFELIAEIDGVKFINDSKATNVDALHKALLAARSGRAGEANILLIAGGKDKGLEFHDIGPVLSKRVNTPS